MSLRISACTLRCAAKVTLKRYDHFLGLGSRKPSLSQSLFVSLQLLPVDRSNSTYTLGLYLQVRLILCMARWPSGLRCVTQAKASELRSASHQRLLAGVRIPFSSFVLSSYLVCTCSAFFLYFWMRRSHITDLSISLLEKCDRRDASAFLNSRARKSKPWTLEDRGRLLP